MDKLNEQIEYATNVVGRLSDDIKFAIRAA